MKKYFDSDQVMRSLRKIAVILEEATETDATLADAFLKTIQAFKTERRRSFSSFSRQQFWELEQMESRLQQKLIRNRLRLAAVDSL